MAAKFTKEELEELRAFDAEVDADQLLTADEIAASNKRDEAAKLAQGKTRKWTYYQRHKEACQAKAREYYHAHKAEIAAYRARTKERRLDAARIYYQTHKEQIRERRRKQRMEHRDEANAYHRAYIAAHPEKAKEYNRRAYERKKAKEKAHD